MGDWSKIQLSYRASRSNIDDSVSLVVQVENNMEVNTLSGLVLQLKRHGNTPVGDVAPRSSIESSEVGPFSYSSQYIDLEVKGKLITPDASVPIKLILPVSLYISPPKEMLSMKDVVRTFLHMVEIQPYDPMCGTLAGQSSTGIPV